MEVPMGSDPHGRQCLTSLHTEDIVALQRASPPKDSTMLRGMHLRAICCSLLCRAQALQSYTVMCPFLSSTDANNFFRLKKKQQKLKPKPKKTPKQSKANPSNPKADSFITLCDIYQFCIYSRHFNVHFSVPITLSSL